MEPNVFDKVKEIDLKKTMEKSYIDYAMSVIAARALPDIRDGLKPVQRRILFSMIELNNGPDKPHRKCARIIGDTMGKYHPHGDISIYGALVNMAQSWSMRYTLVDGHGNFGSVDGDGAAAMRYTEARLSKMAMEMLADINKDTVDFVPNFDETEKEPIVLPARFPNLLINGTTGIAVGMATNIPPHNLEEVIQAVIRLIENRIQEKETSIEELMEIIKGPDFPTGGKILGREGIENAYRTGRGKIKVRAVTEIETLPNGKPRIVVTELPYLVNKARLIEKIAELVKDKRVDGITDLRDESDREGMRIVIELRRDVNANVLLNQLYKHTQLQDTFGANMLALVNNIPRVLNLREMLSYYLAHQEEVITRRTQYDLKKAQERAHILEGLLKALDFIDEIIRSIRASQNVSIAKATLIERFEFSDIQAQAIVDMRLRALTGLERNRLEGEYRNLQIRISYYQEILGDEKKLLAVVKEELLLILEKYSDIRRTGFEIDDEIGIEDLIAEEDVVIAMTRLGYIKRMSPDHFKAQNRGGKGIKGMQTIEDDFIEDIVMTTTHKDINFFTNLGRVYKLKAYTVPEASRVARGIAIVNLLELQADEKITAMIPMEYSEGESFLFMATRRGIIKRTKISDFDNVRRNGLTAIRLLEGDELIEVKGTTGNDEILMVTSHGKLTRFIESEVRVMGRLAVGVRGMRIPKGQEIIGVQILRQGEHLLTVTENGLGKRTQVSSFAAYHRGGKGNICHRITEKSGKLIGAKLVNDDREIFLIASDGMMIRMEVQGISLQSQYASGVKLMNVDREDVKIASIAKIRESEKEEEDSI